MYRLATIHGIIDRHSDSIMQMCAVQPAKIHQKHRSYSPKYGVTFFTAHDV